MTLASCASEILSPLGYFFSSSSARTVRPVSVVVAAMSSTIVRKLRRGLPRQLMLMKEKSRCERTEQSQCDNTVPRFGATAQFGTSAVLSSLSPQRGRFQLDYKPPDRTVPAIVSLILSVLCVIMIVLIIRDRWNRPETKTAERAEHSTTGRAAARNAGARLLLPDPKLSVGPTRTESGATR